MAFTRVQSGTLALSASGAALTPAWNVTPTSGNLLLLKVGTSGAGTFPATPANWTLFPGCQVANSTRCTASLYYRLADGTANDNAPTIALIAATVIGALLEEWSGQAVSPAEVKGTATSTAAGTLTATTTGADAASGNLVIAVSGMRVTPIGTVTTHTNTFNNGAAATDQYASDGAARHFLMGYGVTTGNAAADKDDQLTANGTGTISHIALVIGTFKPSAGVAANPRLRLRPTLQAVNRVSTY